MTSDFSLRSELKNDNLIIYTTGYINNTGGQKILDEFRNYREQNVNKVILNLAESRMVNSIGISFLLEIIESLGETDGSMVFTNLDPSIENTFDIMGLLQYAKNYPDVDTALNEDSSSI